MQTIFDAFMAAADTVPDNGFVCIPPRAERSYYPEGKEFTYAEMRSIALELREVYRRAGYGVGNRVALLLENQPHVYFHWLALNALGTSIVPVNPDYRELEIIYLLSHSEADLVIALPDRVAGLKEIIARGIEGELKVLDAENLPADFPPPRRPAQGDVPDRNTEVALQYTSGTTGTPKGCMLTNEYFFFAGERYIRTGGVMTMEYGKERMYNPLPLFYANTLAISNPAMILAGGGLIIPDRFHPTAFWQDLVATRATLFHYLGIMPPVLLQLPPDPLEREHVLKFAYGAGISPEEHMESEKRFGLPFAEGWGMVEVAICAVDCHDPRKIDTRCVGRPLEGVEFRAVDDEEKDVRPGVEGELVVRRSGPDPRRGFFAGYFKDPEATEFAWRGGWFHTGDAVRRDEDGYYYFVDRKKNIIRRSAQNIAAAEIEAMLQKHEAIARVAVIAAPDELRQEEVMACIILKPEVEPSRETAEQIVQWSLKNMSYFKVPGWVLFMDSLPLTSTQKMQKSRIFPPGVDPRQEPGCLDFRDWKRRT